MRRAGGTGSLEGRTTAKFWNVLGRFEGQKDSSRRRNYRES